MTAVHNGAAQAQPPYTPRTQAQYERARELWQHAKGTDLEAKYRELSGQHQNKEDSEREYQLFLDDVEALFVADPSPGAPPEPLPAPPPETTPEPERQPEIPDQVEGPAELPPAATAKQAAAQPTTGDSPAVPGHLFSHLYAMLAPGAELSLKVVRVGADLTVGIFPPGEMRVPLVVTRPPVWLDEHLPDAMQEYTGAQVEANEWAVAAAAQRKLTAKAAGGANETEGKTAASAKTDKRSASGAKNTKANAKDATFSVNLHAAEGSTLSGTLDGTALALTVGENQVPKGTLIVKAAHPEFGEHAKTLIVRGPVKHDFTAQQGALLSVKVTPPDAAISVTQGLISHALHGERLLTPGSWEVQAEASGYAPESKTVVLEAGKNAVVSLELQEDNPF